MVKKGGECFGCFLLLCVAAFSNYFYATGGAVEVGVGVGAGVGVGVAVG